MYATHTAHLFYFNPGLVFQFFEVGTICLGQMSPQFLFVRIELVCDQQWHEGAPTEHEVTFPQAKTDKGQFFLNKHLRNLRTSPEQSPEWFSQDQSRNYVPRYKVTHVLHEKWLICCKRGRVNKQMGCRWQFMANLCLRTWRPGLHVLIR